MAPRPIVALLDGDVERVTNIDAVDDRAVARVTSILAPEKLARFAASIGKPGGNHPRSTCHAAGGAQVRLPSIGGLRRTRYDAARNALATDEQEPPDEH